MTLFKKSILLTALFCFILGISLSVSAVQTLEFTGDFYEFNAHTADGYDTTSICNISVNKGLVAYTRHNANSFVARVFTVSGTAITYYNQSAQIVSSDANKRINSRVEKIDTNKVISVMAPNTGTDLKACILGIETNNNITVYNVSTLSETINDIVAIGDISVINTTAFAVIYQNSTKINVVLGKIETNNNVTWGIPSPVNDDTTDGKKISICKVGDKLVAGYRNVDDGNKLYTVVVSYNGINTIVEPYPKKSSYFNTVDVARLHTINSTKFLITYITNQAYVVVGTVNDKNITIGTKYNMGTGASQKYSIKINSNTFVWFFLYDDVYAFTESNGVITRGTSADTGLNVNSIGGCIRLGYYGINDRFVALSTNNDTNVYSMRVGRFPSIPDSPSNLLGNAYNETQINLTWTKGFRSDKTHIRYKIGSYPNNITDGTLCYNGTAEKTEATGLNTGTEYYFKAWSWNDTDNLWSLTNITDNERTEGDYPSYDYIIITTESLYDSFNNLTKWKETRGTWTNRTNITTHIELVSNITAERDYWWNGKWGDGISEAVFDDTQCHIRNYIKFAYEKHNTSYIVLGGNENFVPLRLVIHPILNAFCDLYYVGLNGTWNDDLDANWAETGEWDETFELAVGRIPARNTNDVDVYVNTLERFENCTDTDWARKIVLTGRYGWGETFVNGLKPLLLKDYQTYKFLKRNIDNDHGWKYNSSMSPLLMFYQGHGCTSTPGYTNHYNKYGYNNLKYPYINIGTGCKQGTLESTSGVYTILFGNTAVPVDHQNYLQVNKTAIAHFGACVLIGECGQYDGQYFLESIINQTGDYGTALGDARVWGAEQEESEYQLVFNLFGDPETKPYLKKNYPNAHLEVNFSITGGMLYNWYGEEEDESGDNLLSRVYPDTTITGTANSTASTFDHYEIHLGWWNEENNSYPGWGDFIDSGIHLLGTSGEPDNWCTNCVDLTNNGNTEVNNDTLGIINFSNITAMHKGVYVLKLIVTDTTGNTTCDYRYFQGYGWLHGIISYDDGTEPPVGTQVNITFDYAWNSLNKIVTTESYNNHTGYYKCNLWEMTPKPTTRSGLKNNLTAECGGHENSSVYYIGTPYDILLNIVIPKPPEPTCFFSYNINKKVITVTPTIITFHRYKWAIKNIKKGSIGETNWIQIEDINDYIYSVPDGGKYRITLTAENSSSNNSMDCTKLITIPETVVEEETEKVEEEKEQKLRNIYTDTGISDWAEKRNIGESILIGIIGVIVLFILFRKRPKKLVIYPIKKNRGDKK